MPMIPVPGPRPVVWAPRARTVDLVLPGEGARFPGGDTTRSRRVPLRLVGAHLPGWWGADDELAAGSDYAFSLDGGPPRPDPRSPHQPYGVHGPSRSFDPAFDWTDGSWAGREVLGSLWYELHVGTFTAAGTLDAAVERLDHLVDLGVGTVELMPLAAFGGRHGWGYDGVHLYAVHEPYGGPRALQRFVDAAHARGLAVALDVVYNHLGPSGNYLPEFGPYFTDAATTPWGDAVNLDQAGSLEVREWVLDNAARWFTEFHVDALRLDAVHALVDSSPVHLLAALAGRTAAVAEEVGRPLRLVAESDENDPATVTSASLGGRGMDAQWADDVHHAVHALLTGERHGYYVDFGSVEVLRTALTGAFVHDGSYSTFRGRTWGHRVPRGTDGHRFLVFASNHDQVGNRALGDRPSRTLDVGGLAIAAALVLTSAFTPMVFMGEEWGATTDWRYFTDHDDPELAEAIRRGRTAEFGGHGWAQLYGTEDVDVPDPQDPATRDVSVLDWDERDAPEHARLLAWYRTLVSLRELPDIASGDLDAVRVHGRDDDPLLLVERGAVTVVLHLGPEPREVTLPDAGPWKLLAAWDPDTVLVAHRLTIPARSTAVIGRG
ncbi:malto-oligosyltrehalose trehalohydrolase [Oerskovia flava]|uniref:malto-oligosyltrehalose trehalohydrolase n=1 Tax=Oerskovia flava TaxID=2986422 RepID=UPI003CCDF3C5